MTQAEREFASRCLKAVGYERTNAIDWLKSRGFTVRETCGDEYFIARGDVTAKCIDRYHFIRTAYAIGMSPNYGLNDTRIDLAREYVRERVLSGFMDAPPRTLERYKREQYERERQAKAVAR